MLEEKFLNQSLLTGHNSKQVMICECSFKYKKLQNFRVNEKIRYKTSSKIKIIVML